MKRIFSATAILVISLQSIAFCQTDSAVIKNAVSKLRTLLVDHITEKAYLHFDRPYAYYVAGDVVYFKAYVTMGEQHEPTNISGILHVDLINKNDVLMQSIALKLNGGVGWGDFALPDTLQKGTYRIRAYTEWMRNTEHPYFFDQYISVSSINSINRNATAEKQGEQPNIQFFPEGGNLAADIRSKVAFKAINADGLGIDVKGSVVDNENKEAAKIISSHLGMGVFDFIPEEGKVYKAKIMYADGSKSIVPLPAIEAKGITLSVNYDDPDKISIEIKANRAFYKENLNKDLNLVIYSAGALRTIKTKLDNQVLGLDLPANNFSTGILQVTLLSQTGEPLNERMVFIQNKDLLNLTVSANKTAYSKRENVQLNLNVKNNADKPVNGYFSISVTDESKILVDEDSENSILSYLLLTSDVKGYVEKPNYYFTNVTKEIRANMDVLMLTQGYRRFVWKELLSNNSNMGAMYNPEQYMDISGTLKTKEGAPILDATIILLPLAQTEKTDAGGKFRFAKVNFQSGSKFILKMQSPSRKNAAVLTLDKPDTGPAIIPGNKIDAKYNANADILASLQNDQRQGVFAANNESSKVLLKADNVTTPKRADNYRSSNIGGSGYADQVINGKDIKDAPTLSQGLIGVAHNIDFTNGVPYLKSSVVVTGAGGVTIEPMLIIVDGNITSTMDNIDKATVETVEVLKGTTGAIYGARGGAGVMVITTKPGGSTEITNKETIPGIFSIIPKGFYKAREFYSPRYDVAQPGNKVQDNRTTIFWKPDVTTDTEGNASLNFFNAEGAGTYRVEVEGIDNKGNLGRQVFRYKVQ